MTAVVVLHYNRLDLTAECCAALLAQSEKAARVIVVDNCSPAHSADDLAAALPAGVDFFRLPANIGFGRGMNAGMREALRDPAVDSVLFLNNDTRPTPSLIASLRATLASDPAIGLVGCDMTGAGGGSPVPARMRLHPVFAWPLPCPPGEEPDFLTGACLLLPRDLCESLGGFDERYRFFFEDADLSLRVRHAGRRLAVAPGTALPHYGSATIGALSGLQAEWYREGHRIFLRRWYTHPFLRALPPFLFRLFADLLRLRFSAALGTLRGFLR